MREELAAATGDGARATQPAEAEGEPTADQPRQGRSRNRGRRGGERAERTGDDAQKPAEERQGRQNGQAERQGADQQRKGDEQGKPARERQGDADAGKPQGDGGRGQQQGAGP